MAFLSAYWGLDMHFYWAIILHLPQLYKPTHGSWATYELEDYISFSTSLLTLQTPLVFSFPSFFTSTVVVLEMLQLAS